MLLALLSGVFLVLLGVMQLDFLAHFLSHCEVELITASGLLIALSQMRHILGIDAQGYSFVDVALGSAVSRNVSSFKLYTLSIWEWLFRTYTAKPCLTPGKIDGLSEYQTDNPSSQWWSLVLRFCNVGMN